MKLEKVKQLNAQERIWCVEWHPQLQMLATVGQSRSIKLWHNHPQQGWCLQETIQTSHTKSIRCAKFSHKGNALALASFDATISIFMRGQQGYEELTVLEGHQNQVKSVGWSPDDTKFASCSRDKNVWIWSYNKISNDFECQSILQGHEDDVKCVIWLQNDMLASASYDCTVRIWAEQDGQFVPFQTLNGHDSTVWSLTFDKKAETLYSCGEDSKVVKWQKQNNSGRFQKVNVISGIHDFPIFSIALLDSDLLLTGSGDNTLALVNKNEVISRVSHEGDINSLAIKQQLIASGSDDEKVIIWKVLYP